MSAGQQETTNLLDAAFEEALAPMTAQEAAGMRAELSRLTALVQSARENTALDQAQAELKQPGQQVLPVDHQGHQHPRVRSFSREATAPSNSTSPSPSYSSGTHSSGTSGSPSTSRTPPDSTEKAFDEVLLATVSSS